MEKYVIFNADDFGMADGINRGILECHTRGVVTSTSLMVDGRAVHEAVAMSHDYPSLAIGLHWDVCGEQERTFNMAEIGAVRDEFQRQLDRFYHLLGRMPTHIDSHHHVHRLVHLMPVFQELVAPLGVPLRAGGAVRYVGGFYGQWEWLVTNLDYISVPFLQRLLHTETAEGWTEFACHPGYRSPDYTSMYYSEREAELDTLCDARIRRTIQELGLHLASYADYAGKYDRTY